MAAGGPGRARQVYPRAMKSDDSKLCPELAIKSRRCAIWASRPLGGARPAAARVISLGPLEGLATRGSPAAAKRRRATPRAAERAGPHLTSEQCAYAARDHYYYPAPVLDCAQIAAANARPSMATDAGHRLRPVTSCYLAGPRCSSSRSSAAQSKRVPGRGQSPGHLGSACAATFYGLSRARWRRPIQQRGPGPFRAGSSR